MDLIFELFLIQLLGAAMVSLGTYILVLKGKTISNWIDFFFDPAMFIMTFMGSCITVISFCGAYGSLRENTMLLKIVRYFLYILNKFLFHQMVVYIK